jgi:predicted Fe-S protein YdhL (DUF1289 family)
MTGLLTKNPCIDDCDFKKGTCKGCGRSKDEKKQWKHLSAREKHAVWLRILDSHANPGKKKGRQLLERYEKAQKAAAKKAAPVPASGDGSDPARPDAVPVETPAA